MCDGHLRDLGRHVKLEIAAGYISIPEGEGQFVPVIWWVHGDSLTVIQSLATLFLFALPPSSYSFSLHPFMSMCLSLFPPSTTPATPLFGRHWVSCNLDRVTTALNCAGILLLQVRSKAKCTMDICTIVSIIIGIQILMTRFRDNISMISNFELYVLKFIN